MSTNSIAIEPSSWIPSSFRSLMITLASSRATSHRITSPSGFCAPSRRITLSTESAWQRRSSACWELWCGSDDPQVDHGPSLTATLRRL